jgi:two-component system chemotaxis response regulator CheB
MQPGANRQEASWPIVALVASAGGVDALTRTLATLPADLPACVLALLHSDPERESLLPEILRRAGPLEVHAARDGDALQPARVIVAPAGQHLLITHDLRLALIESGAYPPSRPSADLLLTSLALAAGPRAIAVVLSGKGHDGATGTTAVHHFGGIVLATDEASSASFSMPAATIARDDAIDHVVDLDDIGALLAHIVGERTLT